MTFLVKMQLFNACLPMKSNTFYIPTQLHSSHLGFSSNAMGKKASTCNINLLKCIDNYLCLSNPIGIEDINISAIIKAPKVLASR